MAFLESLTDTRVKRRAAPFDHPQLKVPQGHTVSTDSVSNDGFGRATESMLEIPAVGRAGYADSSIPKAFLQAAPAP